MKDSEFELKVPHGACHIVAIIVPSNISSVACYRFRVLLYTVAVELKHIKVELVRPPLVREWYRYNPGKSSKIFRSQLSHVMFESCLLELSIYFQSWRQYRVLGSTVRGIAGASPTSAALLNSQPVGLNTDSLCCS